MTIPLVDLARRWAPYTTEVHAAVGQIVASGRLLLGPALEVFEQEFAAYTGSAHAIGVASGTDALRLIMQAMGIGPGDEVIVPAFTAVPTVAAVCATGATPVPADVDIQTAALFAGSVQGARSPRTKALILVHLYGRPAALPDVGIPVIHDAAQAHGALPAGIPGTATAYSFYPTKNLGGLGDGGAVVTNDGALADRVRLLRHHGMREQYVHEVIATNSRMSEIEAAVLRIGLRDLDAGNRRRREIAARYRSAAGQMFWHDVHERHVYHLCVVRVQQRDAWRARLPFQTGVHYPLAITQQPAYRQYARIGCPNAEAWAAECVSLPCFPEMTDAEVDTVCAALAQAAS